MIANTCSRPSHRSTPPRFSRVLRQCWSRGSAQQRPCTKHQHQHCTTTNLHAVGGTGHVPTCAICSLTRKHHGHIIARRHKSLPHWLSLSFNPGCSPSPIIPFRQAVVTVRAAWIPHGLHALQNQACGEESGPPTGHHLLSLWPSVLRPDCNAADQIFCWQGVNPPPYCNN